MNAYAGSTCSSLTETPPDDTRSPTLTTTSSDEIAANDYDRLDAVGCLALLPSSSQTDTEPSDAYSSNSSRRRVPHHRLPAIGVYWDIENCHVPKGKSAASIVQRIRENFFAGHRQVEFIVVSDVRKENITMLNDLHQAQVTVIHVPSTCKNAADEKLRQSMRHFGETYRAPGTVLLISGDVNFAADLADLRYRKKLRIIIMHNNNLSPSLASLAHELYVFNDVTEKLPLLRVELAKTSYVFVSNLPRQQDPRPLKQRLKRLSDNCGGRVAEIEPENGKAIIRFASQELAIRAQRRLNGEDVFGNKIVASGASVGSAMNENYGRRNGKASPQGINWQNQSTSRGSWRGATKRTPDSQAKNFSCDRNFSGVELIITNLDVNLRDMRTLLSNQIKHYTSAFNVTVNYQDAKPTAIVKVANRQDAEVIISKMQRLKIGHRRINISYAFPKDSDDDHLKQCVVYLLQESPTKSIPLYLLLTKLETKYLMRVSLYQINKLRDVCQIVEENGERLVTLTPEVLANGLNNLSTPQQVHYCRVHCPNGITDLTLWQADMYQPPCISMSLKDFAPKLNKLLGMHMGTLPLMSFTICYNHEFGEPLLLDENGVALEHLVTCVKNVRLTYESPNNKAKYIIWDSLKPEEPEQYNNSPLASSVSLLRREFVDLLRAEPRCQIPLGKFVPAYHHHFGRQLRVADYGYTKLDDLLHSPHLSSVVQILGEGINRILTLTHTAQMRRFSSDLLRMLKSRISKQLTLTEFNTVYQSNFNRNFDPINYGVCVIEDLLEEIPENILVLNRFAGEVTIGIPQRVRTSDEILRTKQFAEDVVKLLSHSPNNSMLFDKFVPHYHHHFGYQCKVSDYGFSKLIELFEAIPETVKVEELPNFQRRISLTLQQSLTLLGTRVLDLIKKSRTYYLPLDQLLQIYMQEYETPLNLILYNCADLKELVGKLSDYVKLSYASNAGPLLIPVQKDILSTLALRVWSLLIHPPHQCNASKIMLTYYMRFQHTITISHLEQLNNIIMTKVSNNDHTVFLIPDYVKAAKLYHFLLAGGEMPFSNLEAWYKREYGEPMLETDDKAYSIFLSKYSFLFVLTRTSKKTSVSLNPQLAELQLPLMPGGAARTFPPKPDTPPPMNTSAMIAWHEQMTPTEVMDFSINMPQPETPVNLPQLSTLMSPAKNLLPAHPNGYMISAFTSAPDPSELPTPDKLIKSGAFPEDSGDSGINNSHFASENEMDASPQLSVMFSYKCTETDFTFKL